MKRPALFRIEQASTAEEVRGQCARALAAGFDGVELAVDTAGSGETDAGAEAGGRPILTGGKNGGLIQPGSLSPPPLLRKDGAPAPVERAAGFSLRGETARAEGRGSVAATTAEDDLKVTAVAGRCVACEIGPALEEVTTLIQRAAGLHAQCLNLTIPPLALDLPPEAEPNGRPATGHASRDAASQGRARGGRSGGFAHYQDALNFAYWLLHRARYEAEAAGVAVALEAATNRCLLSPVELREIIDAANSWAVGACIDVSRTLKIGSPADWLTTLRGRVHAVRVRDVTLYLEAIGAALDEIQYERPVIVLGQGQPDKIRKKLAVLGCPVDTHGDEVV